MFFNFFINQHFWLSLFFMVATELLVLYWLKEIDIYVQDQFLVFLVGYSLLIFGCGIFLGITKQNWAKLHENGYSLLVAIIDPLIVVFFAIFLVQILLSIFYNFL
ncbi:membrane protein [Beggiatoa sp. PS]|nr:membrane protein [Beggiatoa sp. PS]